MFCDEFGQPSRIWSQMHSLHLSSPEIIMDLLKAFHILQEDDAQQTHVPHRHVLTSLLTILEFCGDYQVQSQTLKTILRKDDVCKYREWFAEVWFKNMPQTIKAFIALPSSPSDEEIVDFLSVYTSDTPARYVIYLRCSCVSLNENEVPPPKKGSSYLLLNCTTKTLQTFGLKMPGESHSNSFILHGCDVLYAQVHELQLANGSKFQRLTVATRKGHLIMHFDPLIPDTDWDNLCSIWDYVCNVKLEVLQDSSTELNCNKVMECNCQRSRKSMQLGDPESMDLEQTRLLLGMNRNSVSSLQVSSSQDSTAQPPVPLSITEEEVQVVYSKLGQVPVKSDYHSVILLQASEGQSGQVSTRSDCLPQSSPIQLDVQLAQMPVEQRCVGEQQAYSKSASLPEQEALQISLSQQHISNETVPQANLDKNLIIQGNGGDLNNNCEMNRSDQLKSACTSPITDHQACESIGLDSSESSGEAEDSSSKSNLHFNFKSKQMHEVLPENPSGRKRFSLVGRKKHVPNLRTARGPKGAEQSRGTTEMAALPSSSTSPGLNRAASSSPQNNDNLSPVRRTSCRLQGIPAEDQPLMFKVPKAPLQNKRKNSVASEEMEEPKNSQKCSKNVEDDISPPRSPMLNNSISLNSEGLATCSSADSDDSPIPWTSTYSMPTLLTPVPSPVHDNTENQVESEIIREEVNSSEATDRSEDAPHLPQCRTVACSLKGPPPAIQLDSNYFNTMNAGFTSSKNAALEDVCSQNKEVILEGKPLVDYESPQYPPQVMDSSADTSFSELQAAVLLPKVPANVSLMNVRDE